MLYNIDINECINKYLNCDNILLLRQTFKTNNKFKILENLKIIRNITEDDIVVFKDDKYLLILNLYIDNIISNNKLLKNNNIDIINNICRINLIQKKNEKKNLNVICEFLKNIGNIEKLDIMSLNIHMISSLNRYLNKYNIKLFDKLKKLIIDSSYIETKNTVLYSNIIIEFLKKNNIKDLYFVNYSSYFKTVFKNYIYYINSYNNIFKYLKTHFIRSNIS